MKKGCGRHPRNELKPKILSRSLAYTSPWFRVMAKKVSYPWQRKTETYFSVKGEDYCSVVAVTPDNRVILVRQYRPISEKFTYELPSGCVEKGEDPERAMRRELLEETGYKSPRKMECLARLNPDSGRLENLLWGYFAGGVRPDAGKTKPEPGIETILCSPGELKQLIVEGKFNHAPHVGLIAIAAMKGKLSF